MRISPKINEKPADSKNSNPPKGDAVLRQDQPQVHRGRLFGVVEPRSRGKLAAAEVVTRSTQVGEQRFGVLQIGGLEALGEPAVDRRQ